MATHSFENPPEAPAADPVVEPISDQTPAVIASGPPARTIDAGSDIQGEVDATDIKIPYLTLVQRMSKVDLSKLPPGSWALGKDTLICRYKDGVQTPLAGIVALRGMLQYEEDVEWDSGIKPKTFSRAEDVRADGGYVRDGRGDRPDLTPYNKVAHIVFWIPLPDGLDPEAQVQFPYTDGTRRGALALYTARSYAYANVGKEIISAGANDLKGKGGLRYGSWNLFAEKINGPKGEYFVPRIRRITDTDAVLVKFIEGLPL